MARRWATVMFLLALAASLSAPVYAHTTMGNLNGSSPYLRSNDHELNPTNSFGRAHVPGPLGYVWPGSGLDAYSGVMSNPPGYQSPFADFEQPTQLAGHAYAPEGAILTSTSYHDNVGDMVFAINFSQPTAFGTGDDFVYRTLAIYIPAPVFDRTGALVQDGFEPAGGIDWDGGENTNIVTTITENYGNIFVTRADRNDPFGPSSWLLYITAPHDINFTAARNWSEWYYIRINQMMAPHVAGRYFFKMFLDNHYPVRRQGTLPTLINSTMPMENWPLLLVKGEIDPAIVWGTIRYGDLNNTLYGVPLNLPGKVKAIGIATDPTTGQSTGRSVEARAYLNATAQGHFEIEGVAPGIYDIYASAAGYPEQRVAEGVRVLRGQSLRLDAYLEVGPEFRGKVFSKEGFGPVLWPGQRPVTVMIYDSNTYDTDSIVTNSPTNLTHAPYSPYVAGNTTFSGDILSAPNTPKVVAFPWDGPIGYYSYTSAPTFKDPFSVFNGVGPAQSWWVDSSGSLDPVTSLGSSSSEFVFKFGSKSVYGVPTKFSGMVPQVFATWTDSLSVGRYYVRVFVNGYVQTSYDGTRFVDYSFQVPDLGHSRDITLPIDLQRSGIMNVTVHFHNAPGTMQDAPIQGPDPQRILIAEAFARDGTLAALNFTQVHSTNASASITLNGLGMAGPLLPTDSRAFVKYSLARYRGFCDYGLLTDMYAIHVFMRGYIQALPPAASFDELDQPVSASISVGSKFVEVSTHMYRGGGINATLFSIDWERPPVQRSWVWNSTSVSTLVYDVASQSFVDVIYFWDSNLNQWTMPKQNSEFSVLPYPGWQTTYGSLASLLVTNGSALVDRFGPDLSDPTSTDPSQDVATNVFLQENFHSGFLYSCTSYRSPSFRSSLAIYPGLYALNVWTYGYVQDNVASLGDLGNVIVSISSLGSLADTSIQAIIGINFTIRTIFKTEGILSGIPYNASVRIRVFDEGDTLVAAATMSSDAGTLVSTSDTGFFADGEKLLEQPIPTGTMTMEYKDLAGLFGYVEPSTGGASVRSATLFSPDHGVWGRADHPGEYSGSWLVMVDVVNWYLPDNFYPPVPALLQGESTYFYPYNHLGPYSQRNYAKIFNTAQGGEASIVFELDQRGYVQGTVLGLNWDDGVRTVSWATIQIKSGSSTYYWYTWDGWFDGYLDPGHYELKVIEWTNLNEGHETYSFNLEVGPGQFSTSPDIILYASGIPIPELPAILPILFLVFSSSLAVLKLKRHGREG